MYTMYIMYTMYTIYTVYTMYTSGRLGGRPARPPAAVRGCELLRASRFAGAKREVGHPRCARPSGDILGSFVSNSHLWKRSGVRVMTIFGSHVGPHFPNIGYFEVYGGI